MSSSVEVKKQRYHVVIREPGPAWDADRSMRDQDGWEAHAEFMDALAAVGFIVLGGPLGDGHGRALHIVDAADEEEIRRRFADDPWSDDFLRIDSIEPWTILLEAPGGLA
jgi:uncharacterized protein YciI